MLATITTQQVVTEAFFFAAAICCLFGFFYGWGAAPRVWGDRLVYLVLLLMTCALMAWAWPA
jgi:hypothetical protein